MDLPLEQETTPFVGPRPIQTGELLFGRDREVRNLVALLISKRIVLLHSPSGAGKSSLVNAGLIPALEQRPYVVLPVVRVNREPRSHVASMIEPHTNRYVLSTLLSLETGREPRQRVETSTLVRLSLSEYLDLREAEIEERMATLLIFDQFEEILTFDPIDRGARQDFFEQVGEALDSRRRYCLFAMREDYVGGLDPYLRPVPTQLSVRMRLDLLDEGAACTAIQRPWSDDIDDDMASLTENFTSAAAEELARDLAQMRVQQADGTRLLRRGAYVEPVQLQVVCKRLWTRAQEEGRSQVDVDALKDAGTVDKALAGYFGDSVALIADRRKVPQWRIRDWFDQRLITAQGIRGQIMRDVGTSEGLENEVIEDLIRAYLVRQEQRRGVTWYELAHDRLVDPILQANERWRKENLSPYYARAVRWASESPPPKEMLLRGLELAEMEEREAKHPDKMTFDEEALLEASRKERDEAQVRASREADRRTNLAETGWGVIFADPSLRPFLAELLAHRQALAAGIDPEYYQEFGYQAGETAQQFLARHGIGTGVLEPDRVPFYLMLVGDPQTIPWEFQYELDLQYAVGRIHFDTPDEYAAYARSVVASESGEVMLSPRAVLFGPQNPDDRTMATTVGSVMEPMGERLQQARLQPDWQILPILREEATKAQLGRLLGGPETPALLVTISHGVQFDPDNPRLPADQGALLCQDWPGPKKWAGSIPPDFYFAASDVPDDARLVGLVTFFSSACSAGTPAADDFSHRRGTQAPSLGRSLLARLPQRLLGHPQGGALAVCGHVDRPWLVEGGAGEMPIFAEVVRRLMDGYTVGAAMEVYDQRYAVFAARSSEILRRQRVPREGEAELADWELETLLTAMVDARNYVIFGDPAVRLPVVGAMQAAPRPVIEPVSLPAEAEVPEAEPLEAFRKAQRERKPAAPSDVGAAYVDLEVRLYRREAEAYGVQMRLTHSEPGVSVDLATPDTARVRIDMEALAAALDRGELLSQSLFGEPAVREAFFSARGSAQAQGIPLRLRLYLDPAAPELHALPWEEMADPVRPGSGLALADDLLFSRVATNPDWRPVQLRPRVDLRALVVMANPVDVEQFGFALMDVDLELAVAESSLGAIPTDLLAAPGTATLGNMVSHLQDGYDILYLACHTAAREGVPHIWLEDEQGRSHIVSGPELVSSLRSLQQMPRLVVWMAREATIFAPVLLEAGVPAVLATTGAITTQTAKEVMAVFFEQVLRHGQIDRAVAVARQAVRDRPDWGSLALFMRSSSGRLFAETVADVPFMAPPLLSGYVPRHAELDLVVDLLTATPGGAPVVALTGAGGSGKSVLAVALCHDQRVRDALDGGVLWVTLGQNPDVVALLGSLVAAITGDQPGFASLEAVSAVWARALAERRMLLVIDDVWDRMHLAPFLAGGPRCARLITTRNRALVPPGTRLVQVGAVRPQEAVEVLAAGLPEADPSALLPLAERLEMWPLALMLANAALRDRVLEKGQGLPDAVAYLNRALDRQGLTAFDRRGAGQSLARSFDVILERLDQVEAERYFELAVFPEELDVPLEAVRVLWAATADLDAAQVEALCLRLRDLSLLQDLDLETGSLRLHDVLRSYLLSSRVKPGLAHKKLLDAYRTTYRLGWWADLPPDEPYLWRHLAYHLAGMGDQDGLGGLLLSFDWLQAKLEVAGVASLLADFDQWSGDDESVLLVRGALQLSQHILAGDVAQLPAQLIGRLSYYTTPAIHELLQAAGERQDAPWLQPLVPSLTPPGGPLLRSLVGHTGPVTAVALTPDGRRILSASRDCTLRLWDLESGLLLQRLDGHAEGLTAVAVTPDGRYAVSASNDTTLKVWDLQAGEELRTLTGHTAPVAAVTITPDGRRIISAAGDRTLCVWELSTGDLLYTLAGHDRPVTALVMLPDGGFVLSASADGTLGIWDLEAGGLLSSLEGDAGPCTGASVTPDGRFALSASDGGRLSMWDLETGAQLSTWEGHDRGCTAVAVTPDGRLALSASADRTLKIWDLASARSKDQAGRELATLRGHTGPVTAVAANPDARHTVSASDDGTLKVWDLQRALEMQIEPVHDGPVYAIAFSPDGKRALTASDDTTLKLWDLGTHEVERTLEGHEDTVVAAGFTPDGKRIISTSLDQTVKIWDLGFMGQTRSIAKRLTRGLFSDRAAEYAAKGRAAAGVDADTRFGEELRSWDLTEPLNAFALSPESRRIVTAAWDGPLKVWDLGEVLDHGLGEGKEPFSLAGHDGEIWAVTMFDGGRRAISASEDGTLKIWDLETGRELHTLSGHGGAVYAVATAGASLAVEFGDDAVAVLDDGGVVPADGESPVDSQPPDAPQGRRLAISASADQTLKVWDTETGQELATLTGHTGPVKGVAVAPDGRWAVSASEDRTVRAWDLQAALEAGARSPVAVSFAGEVIYSGPEPEDLLEPFGGDSAFSTCAVSGEGIIVAGDQAGQVHFLGLAEPPPTRTVRIGLHGRVGAPWEEADYQLVHEAGIETVKLLSSADLAVYERLKTENPELEILVRLFDDRIRDQDYPRPEMFAERMIPVMTSLRPFADRFEVHSEPDRRAAVAGWGVTDEDAVAFNEWFLQVYDLLKSAHPWAQLGFPGLYDYIQRNRYWLDVCRPAIERADWLGVHAYWQSGPEGEHGMLDLEAGLVFRTYRELFPEKRIEITEFGGTLADVPFSEEGMAGEMVAYYQELYKYDYVNSACAFCLSGPELPWQEVVWREEDGRMRRVVQRVRDMFRAELSG